MLKVARSPKEAPTDERVKTFFMNFLAGQSITILSYLLARYITGLSVLNNNNQVKMMMIMSSLQFMIR